jgi:SAM-dependent methyltransferase
MRARISSLLHKLAYRIDGTDPPPDPRVAPLEARMDEMDRWTRHLGTLVEESREQIGRTNELLFALPDPQWREYLYRRSRNRWAGDEQDLDLTWGFELPGGPFVAKLTEHGLLDEATPLDVLEIGPGYGRLLMALREAGAPVASFTGLDLSAARIARLGERFGDERTSFVAGDVVELDDAGRYDLCISSLTFKHLFPDFERAATRIHAALRPGGCLAIDLVEGRMQQFQHDHSETFIRAYSRDETEALLQRAGYASVTFDVVLHAPGYDRLLTIARR